jgi:hypothetical protein
VLAFLYLFKGSLAFANVSALQDYNSIGLKHSGRDARLSANQANSLTLNKVHFEWRGINHSWKQQEAAHYPVKADDSQLPALEYFAKIQI